MQQNEIFQLVQALDSGHWGATGLILLLLLESMPVVGLFVPGVFLMVGLGSLSGTAYLSFTDCVVFSAIGALLGDSIGYWLGYLGWEHHLSRIRSRRRESSRRKAEELLRRYGRLAVFLGRFVWFFHPTVPLAAGVTGIRPGWFYLADVPAVVLWVLIYAGIGHWATGAALERTLEFFVVAGVVIGIGLLWFLLRYLRQRRSRSQAEAGDGQARDHGQHSQQKQEP